MSGTTEEANTSAYIDAKFAEMGLTTTQHSYQVPMHHVNSEPSCGSVSWLERIERL